MSCPFYKMMIERRGAGRNPGLRGARVTSKRSFAGIPAKNPRVLMGRLHSPCGGEAKRHQDPAEPLYRKLLPVCTEPSATTGRAG